MSDEERDTVRKEFNDLEKRLEQLNVDLVCLIEDMDFDKYNKEHLVSFFGYYLTKIRLVEKEYKRIKRLIQMEAHRGH